MNFGNQINLEREVNHNNLPAVTVQDQVQEFNECQPAAIKHEFDKVTRMVSKLMFIHIFIVLN